MNPNAFNNLRSLKGRMLQDELYRIVGNELENGYVDTIAQTRAMAEGHSSEAKARAAYIANRIQRLSDELSAAIKQEQIEVQAAQLEKRKQNQQRVGNAIAEVIRWILIGIVVLAGLAGLIFAVLFIIYAK